MDPFCFILPRSIDCAIRYGFHVDEPLLNYCGNGMFTFLDRLSSSSGGLIFKLTKVGIGTNVSTSLVSFYSFYEGYGQLLRCFSLVINAKVAVF